MNKVFLANPISAPLRLKESTCRKNFEQNLVFFIMEWLDKKSEIISDKYKVEFCWKVYELAFVETQLLKLKV